MVNIKRCSKNKNFVLKCKKKKKKKKKKFRIFKFIIESSKEKKGLKYKFFKAYLRDYFEI